MLDGIKKTKLFVQLASEFDNERAISYSKNEMLCAVSRPYGNVFVEVENLSHARNICLDFISHFELSGSNYTGGNVVDEDYNFVARISYNGRVWDNEDWRKSHEIELS